MIDLSRLNLPAWILASLLMGTVNGYVLDRLYVYCRDLVPKLWGMTVKGFVLGLAIYFCVSAPFLTALHALFAHENGLGYWTGFFLGSLWAALSDWIDKNGNKRRKPVVKAAKLPSLEPTF